MKKLFILLLSALILSSCGTVTNTKTVVVDQNGNILETKTSSNGMSKIGTLVFQSASNGSIYQDDSTGCQYILWLHGISPYYDANGNVIGCKNISSKVTGR